MIKINGINHAPAEDAGEPSGIEIFLQFKSEPFHELEKHPGSSVQATLSLANDSGQRRELAPVRVPLTELKWTEPPNPGAVQLTLFVPWDGKDAHGKSMNGKVVVHYHAELISFPEETMVGSFTTAVSGRVTFIIKG